MDELETMMAARVRRHFLTTFAGVGLAAVIGVGGTSLVLALLGDRPGLPIVVPMVLGLLTIPVVGLTSTFRNLRCPKCERSVILQVSTNYSLFSAMASRDCAHCGARIFSDRGASRYRGRLYVLMGAGFVLALATMLGASLAHR